MSEELRPCPFCGAMPDNERGVVRYDPGVICHTKGCLLECRWFPIDDWNTRPIEDALNKRIADLDADNAELKERVAMLDVTAVYKSLGEMGYIEQVANLKAENAVLQSRIAELEGELAELKERFDITDGLLNQATVSIGAVIACCTYNSNAEAMAGAYGISYRAFTMIDNFIKNYNRAVLDGKASTDVKNIICWPPNPQEVQE